MQAWQEVVEAKHLKPGEMAHGRAGGEDVLVLNLSGELRAYINRCGHMNAPLDLGTFKSGVIKCPQHNAVFDARTGEVRAQPILGLPGMDKLPPEFLEAMAKMAPVFARTECRPLTPLAVESTGGAVRVFV
ncbi:MAG: Rieske (2Fe-2S) protein [Thermoplasmata archaeon]|nr:Rieske (2Fe-2S) protein [Thermoplasmata archaeon]MCI4337758.1 Rieske (2Fe-2S) protein [Thermoplasmata archaeon]MCI4341388.1 Rieske (2Fe-2S) protein [Thermoplasmata archaeon]